MKRLLLAALFALVPFITFAQYDTGGHDDVQDLEERNERMRADHATCKDTGDRISYSGFEHCRLHPYYQKVFPLVGCNCSTGQCRPTEFKRVTVTAANPSGIEVEVNGEFYPVPPEVLHKMVQGRVPDPLLEYEAHVCAVLVNGKIVIECVWIRIPS